MSEVINKEESLIGHLAPVIVNSKIEDYKLEEFVMTLFNQGFKPANIASRCNKALSERKDNQVYLALNQANVAQYLRVKRKEMALAEKPEETPLGKNSIDLEDEITNIITILQSEIDKIRNPDGPVLDSKSETLIRMVRELRSTLELVAEIKGRMQPSISISVFESNVTKFVNVIKNNKELTNEVKSLVITLACDNLINDALLKPTQGVEINGK